MSSGPNANEDPGVTVALPREWDRTCGGQALSTRVLVAGIGNLFLGDDGFGPEVVRRLAARARRCRRGAGRRLRHPRHAPGLRPARRRTTPWCSSTPCPATATPGERHGARGRPGRPRRRRLRRARHEPGRRARHADPARRHAAAARTSSAAGPRRSRTASGSASAVAAAVPEAARARRTPLLDDLLVAAPDAGGLSMCLGIPGRVVGDRADGYADQLALVDVEGAQRQVNIGMLDAAAGPG